MFSCFCKLLSFSNDKIDKKQSKETDTSTDTSRVTTSSKASLRDELTKQRKRACFMTNYTLLDHLPNIIVKDELKASHIYEGVSKLTFPVSDTLSFIWQTIYA